MKHIRPLKVDGKTVYDTTKQRECPYCRSQSTLDAEDIGWVPSPVDSRKYICLGCCDDVYSVCASDDFDSSAYRDLVNEAAQAEGVAVHEFRVLCLKQQIDAGVVRLANGDSNDIAKRIDRRNALLAKLETAGQ